MHWGDNCPVMLATVTALRPRPPIVAAAASPVGGAIGICQGPQLCQQSIGVRDILRPRIVPEAPRAGPPPGLGRLLGPACLGAGTAPLATAGLRGWGRCPDAARGALARLRRSGLLRRLPGGSRTSAPEPLRDWPPAGCQRARGLHVQAPEDRANERPAALELGGGPCVLAVPGRPLSDRGWPRPGVRLAQNPGGRREGKGHEGHDHDKHDEHHPLAHAAIKCNNLQLQVACTALYAADSLRHPAACSGMLGAASGILLRRACRCSPAR
mmetsp:Transcript_14325/g.44870  ORF Transcript_14325/g.44870 Transcript_14325/m.44870 type:complete len:269 (+) Transcript_14325:46-852(+)